MIYNNLSETFFVRKNKKKGKGKCMGEQNIVICANIFDNQLGGAFFPSVRNVLVVSLITV